MVVSQEPWIQSFFSTGGCSIRVYQFTSYYMAPNFCSSNFRNYMVTTKILFIFQDIFNTMYKVSLAPNCNAGVYSSISSHSLCTPQPSSLIYAMDIGRRHDFLRALAVVLKLQSIQSYYAAILILTNCHGIMNL